MKIYSAIIFCIIIMLSTSCSMEQEKDNSISKSQSDFSGIYMGQKPPDSGPAIFAPGLVSTHLHEHFGPVFSPDGNEAWWSIGFPDLHVILFSRQENGIWTKPEVAEFSGIYMDDFPILSPDGQRLYFSSKRPQSPGDPLEQKYKLWYVDREGRGWSKPVFLGSLISGWDVIMPSFTLDGSVYFSTRREDGNGGFDIYRSQLTDGVYQEPLHLGDQINSKGNEIFAIASPDEKLLVYSNWGTDGYDGMMLCQRLENGNWSKPFKVGDLASPNKATRFYSFSHDGKYLFYNCQYLAPKPQRQEAATYEELMHHEDVIENGKGNIYWISVAELLAAAEKAEEQ